MLNKQAIQGDEIAPPDLMADPTGDHPKELIEPTAPASKGLGMLVILTTWRQPLFTTRE